MHYTTKKGPSCSNRTTLRNQHCHPSPPSWPVLNLNPPRNGRAVFVVPKIPWVHNRKHPSGRAGKDFFMKKVPSAAPSLTSHPDRLIRVKELRQMLGNPSLSTVYRWIAKGILPEPQRLTPRFIGWRASDIEVFLNSHKNGGGQQ